MNEPRLELSLTEFYPHLVAPSLEGCVRENEEGEILFDYPVGTLSDGVNVLNVVEDGLVQFLLQRQEELLGKKSYEVFSKLMDISKELRKELGYKNREITLLKKRYERDMAKANELLEKERKEYQKAIKENKQYIEWYGTIISPILIIKELYNNGAVAKWGFLLPRSEWKVARMKTSATDKAVRYWLSIFEEWGIFRTYSQQKVLAQMTMQEAFDLLYEKKKEVAHEQMDKITESYNNPS